MVKMKKNIDVPEEHKHKAPKKANLALIIASTSRFDELKSGERSTDKTIPRVKRLLEDYPEISLNFTKIIPDSEEHINRILIEVMKDNTIDSIVWNLD